MLQPGLIGRYRAMLGLGLGRAGELARSWWANIKVWNWQKIAEIWLPPLVLALIGIAAVYATYDALRQSETRAEANNFDKAVGYLRPFCLHLLQLSRRPDILSLRSPLDPPVAVITAIQGGLLSGRPSQLARITLPLMQATQAAAEQAQLVQDFHQHAIAQTLVAPESSAGSRDQNTSTIVLRTRWWERAIVLTQTYEKGMIGVCREIGIPIEDILKDDGLANAPRGPFSSH
jgi:hypothetical protein